MTTKTLSKTAHKIISRHEIGDVWFNSAALHHSLHSAIAYKPGDIISNFSSGTSQNYATYLTVQTGTDKHITLEPVYLQYINHSCNPNVFFDTTPMQVVCLRPIQPGDELVFFYPSTEWEMAQPFICNCGNENCLKFIKGAAYLDPESLGKYRLTDFIAQQAKQNK
ncbi:MAG: SET domain-containing protein-lysine N-methyltransferase [Ferruginibacter sp.]|nr:SET domain-containing protein-lysine N-methyltransferase [Ferruginibacter sp.]